MRAFDLVAQQVNGELGYWVHEEVGWVRGGMGGMVEKVSLADRVHLHGTPIWRFFSIQATTFR